MTIDEKIIEDLKKRKLIVKLFICEDEEGKLQVVAYDSKGLVDFISGKVDEININENIAGNMTRPIISIRKT